MQKIIIDPKVLYDKVVPKCIEKFSKKQNTRKRLSKPKKWLGRDSMLDKRKLLTLQQHVFSQKKVAPSIKPLYMTVFGL